MPRRVELSEAQFERLVGMLADNRVAVHTFKNEVIVAIEATEGWLKQEIGFIRETVTVVEEDLSVVQAAIRKLIETQAEHIQALEGLTQLGKTNFDMNEAILKKLRVGGVTLSHGETEESRESESR